MYSAEHEYRLSGNHHGYKMQHKTARMAFSTFTVFFPLLTAYNYQYDTESHYQQNQTDDDDGTNDHQEH